MKIWRTISIILAAALIIMWLTRDCSGEKTIVTPEVKGTLNTGTPINHTPLVVDNSKPNYPGSKTAKNGVISVINPTNTDVSSRAKIDSLVQVNTKLKDDFAKASDSIKTAMHNKAIQLNEFSNTQEDEHIKITMSGIVQGEIKTISASYTIRPKEVKVPKQSRIGIGIAAGVDIHGSPNLTAGLTYILWKL